MVADGERMCEKMRTFAAMKKPESPLWRHPVVWLRRFRHRCGYGVHSPFAFQLIRGVVYERGEFYAYRPLAEWRQTQPCGQSERLDRLVLRLANEVQPVRVALWGEPVGVTRRYVEAGCRRARVDEVGCGDMPGGVGYDMVYARRPEDLFRLFDQAAAQVPERALMVFEGIHRSRKARAGWRAVVADARATVTFDLYDVGLVFLHPRLLRQHYIVNF